MPHYLWNGEGDNPYFGLLGLADFIVVTADSVNMVSEAASTGKPVYVAALPGGSAKFWNFHQRLMEEGVTRAFEDKLEQVSINAAEELSDWELAAMRDPRNWVKPAVAVVAGGTAAGALLGPVFLVEPTMGDLASLKAFAIVILGGLGNVTGATIGGFALALVEEMGAGYVSSGYRDAMGFAIIIVVLLIKPTGLFARAERVG